MDSIRPVFERIRKKTTGGEGGNKRRKKRGSRRKRSRRRDAVAFTGVSHLPAALLGVSCVFTHVIL